MNTIRHANNSAVRSETPDVWGLRGTPRPRTWVIFLHQRERVRFFHNTHTEQFENTPHIHNLTCYIAALLAEPPDDVPDATVNAQSVNIG